MDKAAHGEERFLNHSETPQRTTSRCNLLQLFQDYVDDHSTPAQSDLSLQRTYTDLYELSLRVHPSHNTRILGFNFSVGDPPTCPTEVD